MSNFNSINNGGVPYYFPADIAKEGQQYARFSNWLKTRVNDNGKKVPVKWYDQGRVMNVNGLIPFIQGMVGHFTTNENDELMPSSDVVSRDWQGSPADVTDGGIAFYTLEDQFFCQEGQFKGVFGLRDNNGNVYTSVNIVFEILGNDLRMGETTKYYSSKLDKMIQEFNMRTDQAVKDFNAKIEAGTENNRAALNALSASIQANRDEQANLSQRIAGTEQQIERNDLIRISDFWAGIDKEKNSRIDGDEELTKRFDNLLSNVSDKSDTNSAPEIKDARLGSKFVSDFLYNTLGNGIRDQFNKLFHLLILSEGSDAAKLSRKNIELNDKLQHLLDLIYSLCQVNSTPLLDQDGVQIETEDGVLINAEALTIETDTTLSQLNKAADAYSVGKAIGKIKALTPETPSGGDMLLSEVPSQPIKFTPDDSTDAGIVLKSTGGTGFDSQIVESPNIIWDDSRNQYIMVYTAYNSNNVGSIGWATSSDLTNWNSQGQLFKNSGNPANGDKNGCTGPCLVKYDGIYYLFYLGLNGEGYEGGPINLCLAVSSDLQSWTYKGILIAPTSDIPWISNKIFHPNPMKIGNYWFIFFNANGTIDGETAERTGFAYSTNIDGPYIVDPDRISKFAEDIGNHSSIQCGDPSIFKLNGLYYMFYFDTSHGDEVVDRYAWTTPGEFPRGWRYGGAVIKNNKPFNKTYAHKPFVLIKDNILYHYYTAVGDEGRCIALQTFDLNNKK